MMQSLDAPASSLLLYQTSSDIRFGDRKPALLQADIGSLMHRHRLSYAQTSQTAGSETNIQSGLLL